MEALFRLCDLLCGLFLLLQVALSDRLFLDLSPSSENGFIAAEVNVSRCDVAQALVVALVVIVIDEGLDLTFEIAGQVIVFQQNTAACVQARVAQAVVQSKY